MTAILVLLASFASALSVRMIHPQNETLEEWWNREGIGWFAIVFPIWFILAVWMELPFGVSEGD